MRDYLEKCAGTAMNSKLIASHKAFFSKMVVDAVQSLDEDMDLNLIGIKKESGGGMEVFATITLLMGSHRFCTGFYFSQRSCLQEDILLCWF